MIPWERLGEAPVPGQDVPLRLTRRGAEFVIRIGTQALMSSAAHGSEESLAELACARLKGRAELHVLIGGLGMGYTLAAALARLGASTRIDVVELIPAVVEWNRGPLKDLAGRPLEDPRVTVIVGDVAERIRANASHYDIILLDVDNGPDGITRKANDWLYTTAGLRASFDALRDGGVLGVWSVAPERAFTRRLVDAGFRVEEHHVRARRTKGGRHTIWLGTRGGVA